MRLPLIVRKRLRRFLRLFFEWGQRFGLNILPMHFYSEIPNIRELKRFDAWKRPYSMHGIRGGGVEDQLKFLRNCCGEESLMKFQGEDLFARSCQRNGELGYGPIETEFLSCFIATKRPRRIVQIGCGVSTAVILAAAEKTEYRPTITCIEPFPTTFLVEAAKKGEIELISKRAQSVETSTLTDLGEGGFLFVDSTHTVSPGSEVNQIILEVLPRLDAGQWVHFHDIFFPYGYTRSLLTNQLFFSNETNLLYSFLLQNEKYRLGVALSMMHYLEPKALKGLFPQYSPSGNDAGLSTSRGDFPSSTYLEVLR